jgi:hypothetical protein
MDHAGLLRVAGHLWQSTQFTLIAQVYWEVSLDEIERMGI